ncbi:MAG: DUF2207 domain-containing protein, partial [Propionicimonas sp.]|nr:DUF2207 domain-containing protein [Propionicimonas sp.]
MRRVSLFGIFGLVTTALVMLPAARAAADDNDWQIDRYTVAATVDRQGTTQVRIDLDFDFGDDPGHGPYISLPLRQEIEGDPDHWRMLDVVPGSVTSSTGANTEVTTSEDAGNLLIRVGSEHQTYTGVQQYTISYTIRGLIAPAQAQSGLDEFNWNVIGTGWEVPIRDITATVTGPVDVVRTACFTGGLFSAPCDADNSSGTTATFSQSRVDDGVPLQIVAGFPSGTFTAAEARLTTRYHLGNLFGVTPLTGGLTAALSALGLGFLIRRTRRGARDEVYLGLTPGLVPAPGQEASVGRGSAGQPVAVQFQPPAGARPGEVGVLTDNTADNTDITATMIDLAVRGYLRIEQTGKKDWRFTRLASPDGLVDYEQALFDGLFDRGDVVDTDDLKNKSYGDLLERTRSRLYSRVTRELHWFTRNPRLVRGLALAAGVGLVLAGVAVGLGLGFWGVAAGTGGFGLLGLSGVVTGIGVLIMNNRFGSRTATGSAMLAQTKGFELYLGTAEADQIRFEEGIDVFSRYLPYAIVFGVAERWTKVFAQLEAEGRYTPSAAGWYI